MLSVGSSLVLQNVGKASPLSNLSEAGNDGQNVGKASPLSNLSEAGNDGTPG